MNEFIEGFKTGIEQTSILEWIATVAAVIYVLLAAKKSILCWYFAFGSSALTIYICYEAQLYVESALNVFYMLMAVVGFILWHRTLNSEKQITEWPLKWHLINIGASLLVSLSLGYFLSVYTDQAEPYVDSFTTVFALAATFMVSKKVLSNWIYWIVIDAVSIYLYKSRGLELFAVLFFLYTVIAVFGFFQWRKKYKLQA